MRKRKENNETEEETPKKQARRKIKGGRSTENYCLLKGDSV
jgi:hypothetical protein